jgi:prepilin-type N-terminal cleavage/methylation domain-containing protein
MIIQPQRLNRLGYPPPRLKLWLIPHSVAADRGFTLSEVIVSILLITTFVAVALQGMVVAMVLKSKSLHLSEANHWVQTDLESIRAQIDRNILPSADSGDRCNPDRPDRGYADSVRDLLAGKDVTGDGDYPLSPRSATSKTGKIFQIQRHLIIPNSPENSRYKILGIEYAISSTNHHLQEPPILKIYAEVLPDAAIQCP